MNSSIFQAKTHDTLKRSLVIGLLLAVAFYVLVQLSGPGQTAFAAGNVTGTVYRDYNADGSRGAREPGLGGITVNAFNAAGDIVVTATTYPVCVGSNSPVTGCTGVNTPAPGAYTLSNLPDGQYRIEFTTTNTGLKPGAFGSGNNTSVQFVTVAGGNVANINASFNSPRDYCQSTPDLITPCYIAGTQTGSTGVLYSHDYTANNPSSPDASLTVEATASQIGSTWGLAYRSTTNQLYAAAYLKRAAGFGTSPALQDRPGQIYRVTPGGVADGATFVVIPNAGGTASTDLHSDFDPSNDDGAAGPTGDDYDLEAFPLVGKASLGDIELNADESALYVVNLSNQHLYEVTNLDALTPTVTDRGLIPNPSPICNGGAARPFGLGWRDDKLYIGGVCDAQTSQSAANLRGYVLAWTPGASVTTATEVMDFSLDFDRQCLNVGGLSAGLPTCRTGQERPYAKWRPWTDTFTTIREMDGNETEDDDTYSISSGNGGYPMPMFSDIVFDGNDMILGFRDRNGDMLGHQDVGPEQTNDGSGASQRLNTTGAGDIYRANPNGSGGWTIENDTNSNPSGIFGPTTAGQNSPQGPGGGEFYVGDNHSNHDETAFGGLAQVPGNSEVASTVLDPEIGGDLFNGGTYQLSNVEDHAGIAGTDNEGARVRSTEIFDYNDNTGRFSKANGLGDLEALCSAAPIEIGNRVWRDDDADGIQDPGEPGISGVQVRLFQGSTAVGTVVTNASGQYYFTSASGTDATGIDYGVTINRNTAYQIRLDRAADFASGGGLYQSHVTVANSSDTGADDLGANADARDSDGSNVTNPSGSPVGTWTVAALTTGGAGNNNHSFDFGVTPSFSVGNRVWYDTDNDGQIDVGESGINNVSVSLLAQSTVIVSGTTYTAGQVITTQSTSSSGYYRFDSLPPGSYSVRVNSANFTSGSTLAGFNSSGTTVNAGINTVDQRDTGVDDTSSPTNGISSNTFTLGYLTAPTGSAPTGESDGANSPTTLPTTDNRSNLTVDFGFYRLTVGDRVWNDNGTGAGGVASDGIQNGTEPGITGIQVQLFRDADSDGVVDAGELVAVATTNASGIYSFTQQTNAAGVGNGMPIVPASNYRILIASGQANLFGLISTTDATSTTNPTNTGNGNATDDNGKNVTPGGASLLNGALSDSFTLGAGGVANTAGAGATTNGTTDNPTLDFGFKVGFSLGNRVWFDTDNDNVRDTGELGVSGVTVQLLDSSNNPVNLGYGNITATTNASGYYRFDYLPAGTYRVRVAASNFQSGGVLAGYQSTTGASGATDNNDDGVDDTTPATNGIVTNNIVLGPTNATGETDTSGVTATAPDNREELTLADFGFYRLTVGNRVWSDNGAGAGGVANNGTLDGTEAGISGVTVRLFRDSNSNGVIDSGELVAVTTTDASGNYLFTQQTDSSGVASGNPLVPANNYKIQIASGQSVLLGFQSSADGANAGTPMNTDSDDNGAGTANANTNNTTTSAFTISNGGSGNPAAPSGNSSAIPDTATINNPRVDFGFVPLFSIGNRVWFDTDNDGEIDGGEVGVSGVAVQLLDNATSNVLQTATTDGNGYYRFDNLQAGSYRVRLPFTNWTSGGTPLAGYQGSTGQTSQSNGNPNNTLDLRDNGDNPSDVTTSGLTSTTITLGASNPATTGETQTSGVAVTSPDARENLTVDFGIYRLTMGNTIFRDDGAGGGTANNGIQDSGETGISGIQVQLFLDADNDGVIDSGELVAVTTTNASGVYGFTQQTNAAGAGNGRPLVPASTYKIQIAGGQSALVGYVSSADGGNAGTPMSTDSDDNGVGTANGNTGATTTSAFTLSNGGTNNPAAPSGNIPTNSTATIDNPRVDLGFVPVFSIGNRVWLDDGTGGGTANDGIRNGNEPGVSGVTVQLRNSGGTVIATTPTNANGYYRFDNVVPGTYSINIPNTMFTGGNPLFGYTNSTNGTVNAGNTLSNDSKDNGVNDNAPGTNGIHTGNFTLGASDNAPMTESDTSGVAVTTTDSRENLTIDLGFVPAFSLGNRLWFDTNNDGVRGGGESNVGAGVTVELLDGNGTAVNLGSGNLTTTTNANGYYRFDALPAGTYRVRVAASNFQTGGALAGYRSSTGVTGAGDNNDDGIDDSAPATNGIRNNNIVLGPTNNAATGESDSSGVTVTSPDNREELTLADFGLYKLQISGTVFVDTNNNGALDSGETPNNGAESSLTVNLYTDNGTTSGQWDAGDTLVATTQTDSTGNYNFTSLPAGSYIVGVVQPSGYRSAVDTANATDTNTPNTGADNNDNGVGTASGTVYSKAFTLNAGDSTTNLGNTVTNDTATTSNNKQDFGITSSPTAVDMGDLSATANADGTVTLKWDTLNELTILGFNVLRGATKQDATTAVNTELVNATSTGQIQGSAYEYTDTSVEPDTTYFYKLEILRPNGSRETTKAVKVTTAAGACSAAPAAPNLIGPKDGSKVKKGKLTFSWESVECAASYKWQLRQDAPDGSAVAAKKNLTVTQTSIKKLEAGRTYYWRAQACNADDSCTASDWQKLTVKQVKEKKSKNKNKNTTP